MNNATTKKNTTYLELTPYEYEQPIAALLGDYLSSVLSPNRDGKSKIQKQSIEQMSGSAVTSIELWSRGISFLIWKASVSGDVCEQTISSMGSSADALSCFSTMVQPLSDLKRIEDLEEKTKALRMVPSGNGKTETSRATAHEANIEIKHKMDVMLSELEAIASTSMHRVMDGIENENPVSNDTLIGLFSGISRQTEAIQRESDKIKTL